MDALGRDVRNVGHAFVGDNGYLKIYTRTRPILNVVWQYDPAVALAPQEEWFTTWTDDDEEAYMKRVEPRSHAESDQEEIAAYFRSQAWTRVLEMLADDEIEHFHAFVRTEIDPHALTPFFVSELEANGFELTVPVFYLAQSDDHPLADGRSAMWIGLIPDGTKSLEVSCIHSPGVVLEAKEMSDLERLYGGDGWTTAEHKAFIQRSQYEILTLNEAVDVVTRALSR
jgi:hypothetical protein